MKYNKCPICGCEKTKEKYSVNNWIFKNVDCKNYLYFRCLQCGCIYREEKNIDYSKLYDCDYGVSNNHNENVVKRKLKKIRDSYAYMGKNKILGSLLNNFKPALYPYISEYKNYLSKGNSFLDVGCRLGKLVSTLRDVGANAYGIEPYIENNIIYENGAIVEKKFIYEVKQKYNIIFYDNVFEHLDTPWDDLKYVYNVLENDGICGLVFPGYGDLIENYGKDAFVFQAPQHTFLYTPKSLKLLSERNGFDIISINRSPVEVWYIKSYLLKNNMNFRDEEKADILKERIPKNQLQIIKKQIEISKKNNTGDKYHVMLRKR